MDLVQNHSKINTYFISAHVIQLFYKNNIDNFLSPRNNRGGGVAMIRALNATIEGTFFLNNTAAIPYSSSSELEVRIGLGSTRYGGGLTIFIINESFDTHFSIRNCTFRNNQAFINELNQEDALRRPQYYIPRGHGGGVLVLFQNSSNHEVTISDCLFEGNVARFRGGAVAVQFYRGSADLSSIGRSSSFSNTITFQRTHFFDNSCHGYGGGIAGHAFEGSLNNSIIFQDGTMRNNSAVMGGGAISFSTQVRFFSSFNTCAAVKGEGVMVNGAES